MIPKSIPQNTATIMIAGYNDGWINDKNKKRGGGDR